MNGIEFVVQQAQIVKKPSKRRGRADMTAELASRILTARKHGASYERIMGECEVSFRTIMWVCEGGFKG